MRNKRRVLSLLAIMMAAVMFLVACGGGADEDKGEVKDGEPAKESAGGNQIIIGNTSELSGDWGAPWFQNNASDRDITNFVRGLKTVEVTMDGEHFVDETVVKEFEEIDNEDGTKTMRYTINDGLKFSDGKEITAEHYVADALFWNSDVVGNMKAQNTKHQRLVGWDAYHKGEAKEFSGVRLIDDNTFEMIISAEELPYYYILAATETTPLDIEFWAGEEIEIKDDGDGAYFSEEFNLEDCKDRIEEARREIPRPASGPYELKSFNESTKEAILEINENYPGNFEGQKPEIQTVIYKHINDETAFDELSTGQVDLLAELNSGDQIDTGLDLVEEGGYDYVEYPRAGYGKVTFVCDHGPTQFKEVRQAMAHLLDRNDFAKAFTGGYGSVVNGPYGEAQWFYQETKDELNKELNQYPYDLDLAISLLEEGGWTLNEDGEEYTEGIRYKEVDGELMPLILEWGSSEDNEVSDLLVVNLQENPDLEKAGIKINQDTMTFPELLNYLYREGGEKYEVPTYHMFNLATGFQPVYDMRNEYTTDPEIVAQGANDNYILDEDLAEKAKAIAQTEAGEREEFKEKFVDFIVEWNELMPDLPLYSNIYHDFYNDKIEGYEKNAMIDIPRAILYSTISE